MGKSLIWINACEASADAYGALLMQELRRLSPEMEIMGMGGQAMRDQGLDTVYNAEDLSLVGLTEVFTALPRIAGYLGRIRRILMVRRPKAMVLMDSPDFNFRLARMACDFGIPVTYYIAPQVWAWRKSRIRFLKKYVSRIACIFPFEQGFFREHGISARYVGHPLLDLVDLDRLWNFSPRNSQIALLPGSRKREIAYLLPLFTDVAQHLHQRRPDLVFGIVRAPGVSMEFLHRHTLERPYLRFISPENRHRFLRQSSMALAASGTITLECAVLDVPTVVAYRLSWASYLAGRLLINVPYISMPNLILDRAVYPELIQNRATVHNLLRAASLWLDNPSEKQRVREELHKIRGLLGKQKATRTCARMVLDSL